MFPHRSGSQETLNGRLKLLRLLEPPPAFPDEAILLTVDPPFPAAVMDGDVVTTGYDRVHTSLFAEKFPLFSTEIAVSIENKEY